MQFNWSRIQISMIEPNISTPNHLIQHHVEAKTIHLTHFPTLEQIAYIFTKALGRKKFEKVRMQLGMSDVPSD